MNNGTKLFLQLESTDKNLSRALLKVKIEQSYENVVIRLVGPGAITSGTGAPSNILTALANASDHLPIVADYVEAPELSSGLLLIAGFPIAVIAMPILASRHVRPGFRSTCGIPSFALAPGRRGSDG